MIWEGQFGIMYSFRIIEQSTSLNTTPMLVPHFVTTVDLFYTG